MSVNDFKKRPRLSISLTFQCSGQFNPFTGFGALQWSLTGTLSGQTGTPNVTVYDITCQRPTDADKIFGFFRIPGSTGNTSGTIDVGVLPEVFPGIPKGEWTVNTSPVLAEYGMVAGEPGNRINYYVVAMPTTPGATADTPINITPPIDELKVVYPGDFISIDRLFGTQRWYVYPQRREPKPDRTFFWSPNEIPFLTTDGKADGKLVKPGTVMIPTKTENVKGLTNPLALQGYFINGIGIMWDGQTWVKYYDAKNVTPFGTQENLWPLFSYRSPNLYEYRFEFEHTRKFLIETNTRQEEGASLTYTEIVDGEPSTMPAYFNFGTPFGGIQGNFQGAPVFYDHGDAYSFNYKKEKEFYQTNGRAFNPASGDVIVYTGNPENPEKSFSIGVQEFENGNQTEYEEIGYDDDGNELRNTFKISVLITTTGV